MEGLRKLQNIYLPVLSVALNECFHPNSQVNFIATRKLFLTMVLKFMLQEVQFLG